MGCGGSKEAVATGNSGSSRCNRFKRKSSVVDATQPSSRVLQPSVDNASTAAAAKANNGEVVAETKDKAATLKLKAVEEKKEGGINGNKAGHVVKDSKEAVVVKEGNATSKANANGEEKPVEIKTDEAVVTDAARQAVAAAVEKAGKEALAGMAAREKEGDEVVVKDKAVVAAGQKAGVSSAKVLSAITEEIKEEDTKKDDDVVEISTGPAVELGNGGDDTDMAAVEETDDEAASTEDVGDVVEENNNKEDDGVTFPVSMVAEEDGSVTFAVPADDAEARDDDESVTFATAAAPTTSSTMVAVVAEEDGSVSFAVPVSPVIKDDDESVTSAAAPATKVHDEVVAVVAEEGGSVTFAKPLAPVSVTKGGHSVTFVPARPATKDDDSVASAASRMAMDNEFVSLPVAQEEEGDEEEEEEVEERPEPSKDNEEVEDEAELAEATVFDEDEAMAEADGDGATEADEEEEAGQSEPSEDNEVNDEADLPDPTAVEQLLTKVVEEIKVEEEMSVDTVGKNKVEEEEESVSKEPHEGGKPVAPLRDEDGEPDGKEPMDLKEAGTTEEKTPQSGIPEKKSDDEKDAALPLSASSS